MISQKTGTGLSMVFVTMIGFVVVQPEIIASINNMIKRYSMTLLTA
jgi:hypothetical protein